MLALVFFKAYVNKNCLKIWFTIFDQNMLIHKIFSREVLPDIWDRDGHKIVTLFF